MNNIECNNIADFILNKHIHNQRHHNRLSEIQKHNQIYQNKTELTFNDTLKNYEINHLFHFFFLNNNFIHQKKCERLPLTQITIPSFLTSIENSAFSRCSTLTKI